jgi:hypothetical protein
MGRKSVSGSGFLMLEYLHSLMRNWEWRQFGSGIPDGNTIIGDFNLCPYPLDTYVFGPPGFRSGSSSGNDPVGPKTYVSIGYGLKMKNSIRIRI